MKKIVQDAVNDQIQKEFHSAYLYLAMSAHCDARNLKGFAHWLHIQWQEETTHALKLYNHLLRRGGAVELKTIEAPVFKGESPLQLFEEVLAHEQFITASIYKLYDLAVQEKDYALQTLLHWFINEQVEEEENATAILEDLKRAGDSGPNLFMIDRELGGRSAEADSAEEND